MFIKRALDVYLTAWIVLLPNRMNVWKNKLARTLFDYYNCFIRLAGSQLFW